MMEIQAKEELIDMKAEPEQGEKICRKTYLIRLGVDNPCLGVDGVDNARLGVDAHLGVNNPRLGVDARLGVEMAHLGKPAINKKDS